MKNFSKCGTIHACARSTAALFLALIIVAISVAPVFARDDRGYHGHKEYREHRRYYGHERPGGYYYRQPVYVAPPPVVYAPPPPPPGITFVFPLHIR